MISINQAVQKAAHRGIIILSLTFAAAFTFWTVWQLSGLRSDVETLTKNYFEEMVRAATLRQDELSVQREVDRFASSVGKTLRVGLAATVWRGNKSIAQTEYQSLSLPVAWLSTNLFLKSPNQTIWMDVDISYATRFIEWLTALAVIVSFSLLAALIVRRQMDKSVYAVTTPIMELAKQVEKIAETVLDRSPNCVEGNSSLFELELLRSSITILLRRISDLKEELFELGLSLGRRDLAAQVVHDLRVPLTALDTILNRDASCGDGDIELLKKAAARLTAIASDLLNSERTRISPGSKDESEGRRRSGSSVTETVNSVIDLVKVSTAKAINFEIQIPADAESVGLPVSATTLERILFNLLGNAIDATPDRGRVTIELSLEPKEIKLVVKDSGKGIPAGLLSQLGKRGATFGKLRGTGLGLHFVKSAATKHGGEFSISSSPAWGTRIEIAFPRFQITGETERKTVVLVDDDLLVREVWRASAAHHKWKLISFSSAKAFFACAHEMAKTTSVYVDLKLGDESGIELGRKAAKMGFTELYLATGIPKSRLRPESDLTCFRGVVGKSPPWEGAIDRSTLT